MFDKILMCFVVASPTLLAIGIEIFSKDIRGSRAWKVTIFGIGVLISAATFWQISRQEDHARQAQTAVERDGQRTQDKLDQALRDNSFVKGQLSGLGVAVGKIASGSSNRPEVAQFAKQFAASIGDILDKHDQDAPSQRQNEALKNSLPIVREIVGRAQLRLGSAENSYQARSSMLSDGYDNRIKDAVSQGRGKGLTQGQINSQVKVLQDSEHNEELMKRTAYGEEIKEILSDASDACRLAMEVLPPEAVTADDAKTAAQFQQAIRGSTEDRIGLVRTAEYYLSSLYKRLGNYAATS